MSSALQCIVSDESSSSPEELGKEGDMSSLKELNGSNVNQVSVEVKGNGDDDSAPVKDLPNETHANWFSRIFLFWFLPVFIHGYRNPIHADQVKFVEVANDPTVLYDRFAALWKEEVSNAKKSGKEPSLIKTAFRSIGYGVLSLGFCFSFVMVSCTIGIPFISKELIELLDIESASLGSKNQADILKKGLLSTALIILPFITAFSQAHLTLLSRRVSMHLFSIFTQAVFRKSLLLSAVSRNEISSGKLINLISSDAGTALERMLLLLYPLILAIPTVIVVVVLIFLQIGLSAVAGVAFVGVFFPINIFFFFRMAKVYFQVVGHADLRIGLITETLQAIRVVKMYAWENPFIAKIRATRNVELTYLRRHALLFSVGLNAVFVLLPFVAEYLSLTTYFLLGNPMLPAIIFTALQLFQVFQSQFSQLPNAIAQLSQSKVAFERLRNFLIMEEMGTNKVMDLSVDPMVSSKEKLPDRSGESTEESDSISAFSKQIILRNASFSWYSDDSKPEFLKDLNVHVKFGQRVAVFGQVACGKSSFLMALAGELRRSSGESFCPEKISYASQTPFVLSRTVRDNILFGNEYDANLYAKVLDICCLLPDLEILPAGDKTFIGENGINLSGGQKARVGLARAVYAQADVTLLDDPLSAVDAHVGSRILSKCIFGSLLEGRTVIMTTNHIETLQDFDQTIFLEDGKIVQQGVFGRDVFVSKEHQLTAKNNDNPNSISRQVTSISVDGHFEGVFEDGDDSEETDELYKEEDQIAGTLKWSVFSFWIQAAGSVLFFSAFGLFAMYLISPMFSQLTLTWWTQRDLCLQTPQGSGCESILANPTSKNFWFYVYTGIVAGGLCLCLVSTFLIAQTRVQGSRRLHDKLLISTFSGGITNFFDVQPMGRVINRFAKDMSIVDFPLPQFAMFSFVIGMYVINAFIAIAVGINGFLALGLLPIVFVIAGMYVVARKVAMKLQRLEAQTRSPIYSTFSEAVIGLRTIRVFRKQDDFIELNLQNLLANVAPYFLARVVLPSSILVYTSVISLLIMVMVVLGMFVIGSINPSQAGLAITNTLRITQVVNFAISLLTDFEISMNSVERIKDLCETIEPEDRAYSTQFDKKHESKGKQLNQENRAQKGNGKVPEAIVISSSRSDAVSSEVFAETNNLVVDNSWPAEGRVEINNLVVGYREGPDVLHGISLSIKPGEKLGVCGRTGSGKSSFFMALLRVVEARSGSIFIDNVDISNVSLERLRSHIAIIPQNPVMFRDTVRFNLDPVEQYSDDELIKALNDVQLYDFVDNLDMKVAEGGGNISEGQRQLVCFVRAMLRKSRLLLLDEATAMLDSSTDDQLQQLIGDVFAERTVITVAHRLKTLVKNSTRVVVLDNGKVAEVGEMEALVEDSDSLFSKMLQKEERKAF